MTKYVMEQQEILVQLGIWEYLNEKEIDEFYACATNLGVDRLARKYRDKYWDQMINDYENRNTVESDIDESVEESNMPARVKYILLRNKICTSDDFLDIMMEKGWNSIRGLGESSVKIVLHWVFPDEDITNYVKKYKTIKEERI